VEYRDYYNEAMRNYQPAMNEDMAKNKAALADQGLVASTAGQGALADVRNKYMAQARNTAQGTANEREQFFKNLAENQRQYNTSFGEGQRQYNTSFGEGQRQYNASLGEGQRQYNLSRGDSNNQFGVNSAMKAWEMLNARALGWKEVVPTSKIKLPKQTKLFGDLAKYRYQGDPPENEGFAMMNAPGGKTIDQMSLEAQQADGAAGRAVQNAQLALEREKFDWQKSQEQSDPWAEIMSASMLNRDALDPEHAAAGYQAQEYPTQMLALFRTNYGKDIVAIAKDENHPEHEKALAVLKTLYPGGGWAKVLGQQVGSTPPQANAAPAASAPTGASRFGDFARESAPNLNPVGWIDALRQYLLDKSQPQFRTPSDIVNRRP